MYYDKQVETKKNQYKDMLKIVGSISRLFSDAPEPYLYYRAHENIFAKYFEVNNNARSDDSADVYDEKLKVGIGLKTWVGQNTQKVAEFGGLRTYYANLDGIDLIKKISEYRNKRIQVTMNSKGLTSMLYHIVKRIPKAMQIYEYAFDKIDIDKIKVINNKGGKNTVYFTDGKHTYNFNKSKSTLYMLFDNMELLDKIDVNIYDDPYIILSKIVSEIGEITPVKTLTKKENQLCLRLYSSNKRHGKFVPLSSGLNQWNGYRKSYKIDENGMRILVKKTQRDDNELYIPYPKEDRDRGCFFPPKEESFDLLLPDGKIISAKVCQAGGKAIMSNPNKVLGKWLLRDVLNLNERQIITYDMLKIYNIDSVIFTKLGDKRYSIDFCELGTYERFYDLEDSE